MITPDASLIRHGIYPLILHHAKVTNAIHRKNFCISSESMLEARDGDQRQSHPIV
jgi:hypothetical protein